MHRTKQNQRLTQNYQRKRSKDKPTGAPSGRTRTTFTQKSVNLHRYAHTASGRLMKASNQHDEGEDIFESTMMRTNYQFCRRKVESISR